MKNLKIEEYEQLKEQLIKRYRVVCNAAFKRSDLRTKYQVAIQSGNKDLEDELWIACDDAAIAHADASNRYHAILERFCLYVLNNEDYIIKSRHIPARRRGWHDLIKKNILR